MAQVLVNIRMDETLKKNMEHTCQELGMNLTTAFTIFAKKMSREKRIPFDVSIDPFYSPENLAALRTSREQSIHGNLITKTLDELEAMEK